MYSFLFATLAIVLLSFQTSASGFKIAYMQEISESEKNILVFDTSEHQLMQANDTKIAIYPSISKDGKNLAYIGGESLEKLQLFIVNLDSNKKTEIKTDYDILLHPHLSADGNFLSFTGQNKTTKRFEINVYSLTEKKIVKRLESETENYFFPKFFSDSSEIILQSSIDRTKRNLKIWKWQADKVEALELPYPNCMAPQVSVDDANAVFTCKKEEHWSIFHYNFKSKDLQQLSSDATNDYAPTFDYKGNIYFASNRDEIFKLYKTSYNPDAKTYEKAKVYMQDPAADLYSPAISGDPSYLQWEPSKMPKPTRSSFGAISHQGKLYFIGGHMGAEHTYPPESFSNAVSIYDPATKTWTEGAVRPAKAHGYGLAACGDYIYAFGGFAYSPDHEPKWKSLERVDRYNPKTNTWKYIGDMPRRRSSNAVVKLHNKVYLAGGWNSTPKFKGDIDGKFHAEIDVFNCDTESFEESNLQIPAPLRRAFTGVAQDGKILFIGGISEGGSHFSLLNNVTEFNPQTGDFKELSPLPFATFAPAAGVLNDNIYVFGGMFNFGGWNYKYVNHIYKFSQGKWTHTGRHLKKNKGFSQVIPFENKLVISGGHSYDGNSDAPVDDLEFFKD